MGGLCPMAESAEMLDCTELKSLIGTATCGSSHITEQILWRYRALFLHLVRLVTSFDGHIQCTGLQGSPVCV